MSRFKYHIFDQIFEKQNNHEIIMKLKNKQTFKLSIHELSSLRSTKCDRKVLKSFSLYKQV